MIPNQWTQPTKLYNIIYVVVEKVTDVAFSFYRINTGCNIVIILVRSSFGKPPLITFIIVIVNPIIYDSLDLIEGRTIWDIYFVFHMTQK